MGINFAGFDCLDPVALHESLQRNDPPVGTDGWYGKVNVYRTSLGLEPGVAKLLMSQRDIEQLVRTGDIDRPHVLEWSSGKSPPVKLKDLYVERWKRIYPAAEDDHASALMVDLVDKRGILKRIPVDKRYNVYECPCGEVLATTKNAGSLWTWSTMVGDLWAVSSALGTFPGLPFTPHGTPSNFVFEGMTLFEALTHVFTRLSVSPFYDPIRGTWQIFQLGKSSDVTRATRAIDAWTRAGLKVWDDFPDESTIANIPEKARITFRKQPLPTDGTSWEYHLDVAPTTALAGLTEAGTTEILWDDLPALYCSAGLPSASLANSSDLTARAAERAADYYRLQERVFVPRLQAFKGVRADSLLGLYGGAAVVMAIQDRGTGYKWELLGGRSPPGQDLESWMPYQRFRLNDSCDGDDPDPPDPPVGECAGCGWLLDWPVTTAANCLRLTILGASGKCQCIDAGQEIDLFYDSGGSRWLGGTFATCCGCSAVEFTRVVDTDRPEVFGKLRLIKRNVQCDTSDQTEYKLSNPRCCAPGTIDFDGANTNPAGDNCDGALDECSNYFVARIECIECPVGPCCCPGCECTGCACSAASPPARYLDLSSAGFTGAGVVLNVPWVLEADGCEFLAECLDPVVDISLTWVGEDTTGWRLSISVTGGAATYETANEELDCCDDIVLTKISSDIGGPSTLTLVPLGSCDDGNCPDRGLEDSYTLLVTGGTCTCLVGVTFPLIKQVGCGGLPDDPECFFGESTQGCPEATSPNASALFGCDEGVIQLRFFCSEAIGLGTATLVDYSCNPETYTFECTENGSSDCCPDGTFTVVIF
jgi:hypothetical protein